MQRARCCAANAYDVTSAFHAVLGRTSRPCLLGQPRNVYNAAHSQSTTPLRPYSVAAEDTRQNDPGASTADRTTRRNDSRARKLAFYEELMGTEPEEQHDRTPQYRTPQPWRQQKQLPKQAPEEMIVEESPWDAHPLAQSSNGERLWKARMAALSGYIRENRPTLVRGIPEDEQSSDPAITLDYKGLVLPPEKSKLDPPVRAPWTQSNHILSKEPQLTATRILDMEIAAFAENMSLTPQEVAARTYVRNNITYCIKGRPENAKLTSYRFGSTQTGVAMPYSDIDMGIYDPEDVGNPLEKQMEDLFRSLRQGTDYMCVVYRPPPNAIVTAQHVATGIDVQVIAKGQPGFQDNIMKRYLKKIPHMHELYAVVRTAFGMRGFVDPFIGGISAYGTFMMLAAALTRRGTPAHVHESPATQLLHFLSFWSSFDLEKHGMSLGQDMIAKPFPKIAPDSSPSDKTERNQNIKAALRRSDKTRAGQYRIGRTRPRQPYLLCLQDPANSKNDLGGHCHAIKHIQATIKAMHADLVHSMAETDTAIAQGSNDVKSESASLLLPLVGRCHEMYAERRERMVAAKLGSKNQLRSQYHHLRKVGIGRKESLKHVKKP